MKIFKKVLALIFTLSFIIIIGKIVSSRNNTNTFKDESKYSSFVPYFVLIVPFWLNSPRSYKSYAEYPTSFMPLWALYAGGSHNEVIPMLFKFSASFCIVLIDSGATFHSSPIRCIASLSAVNIAVFKVFIFLIKSSEMSSPLRND